MKWDRSIGRPEPIAALNRIVERESDEPLVDMRIACPQLVPMRVGTIPWCRVSVAEMANEVAHSLPKNIKLGYVEAWRPFVRQKAIYDWMWNQLEVARPGLSYATKRRIVCRWVAPVDQKAPPGHCTGAALDVYLLDTSNQMLDVVSPFDRFTGSKTHIFGLTEIAAKNRKLLYDSMTNAGFSNCREEFWHYSFGDAGWAVRIGKSTCQYGLVELPREHWEDSQAIWETTLNDRPNPFLTL